MRPSLVISILINVESLSFVMRQSGDRWLHILLLF